MKLHFKSSKPKQPEKSAQAAKGSQAKLRISIEHHPKPVVSKDYKLGNLTAAKTTKYKHSQPPIKSKSIRVEPEAPTTHCTNIITKERTLVGHTVVYLIGMANYVDQVCLGPITEDEISLDGESIDIDSNKWWFEEMGIEIVLFAKSKVSDFTRRTRKAAESRNDSPSLDDTNTVGSLDSYVIDAIYLTQDKEVRSYFETEILPDDATHIREEKSVNFEDENPAWSFVTSACSFENAALEDEAIRLTKGKPEYDKVEVSSLFLPVM